MASKSCQHVILFSGNIKDVVITSTFPHEVFFSIKAAILAALESPAKYHAVVVTDRYPLEPYQLVDIVARINDGELLMAPGRLHG